jgi:hypothetical protein
MVLMDDPKSYDTLSAIALLVGFYEGLLPFPAQLFGFSPLLSLPAHMDAPAWWIVSGLVLIATVVALERLGQAKRRRFGPRA